jgi:hypothetical protein
MMLILNQNIFPGADSELLEALEQFAGTQAQPGGARLHRDIPLSLVENAPEIDVAEVTAQYHRRSAFACPEARNFDGSVDKPALFLRIDLREESLALVIDEAEQRESRTGPLKSLAKQEDGNLSRDFLEVMRLNIGPRLRKTLPNPYGIDIFPSMDYALERHICVLLMKAKLHQLSESFRCFLSERIVEFGEENCIDFRTEYDVTYDSHEYLAGSGVWAPEFLRTILRNACLWPTRLYDFAARYLSRIAPEKRTAAYSAFLASFDSGWITERETSELLRLADESYRTTLWLEELRSCSVQVLQEFRRKDYALSQFITESKMTEGDALDWLATYHPRAFSIVTPPARWRKTKLEEWAHPEGPFLEAHEGLDRSLAAETSKLREQIWRGRCALRDLDYLSILQPNDTFSDFQAWAKRYAPLTYRESTGLREHAQALVDEANAAALEKRRATLAQKRLREIRQVPQRSDCDE